MSYSHTLRNTCLFAFLVTLLSLPQTSLAQTDWDAYMLHLVNQARTNPAQENAVQGTNYTHAAVTPLAYDLLIADAAQGHNDWMHLNIGNNDLVNTNPPRSFSHNQTHDGTASGTPLTSSPGFTGAGISDRITNIGFNWSTVGENILTRWSSEPIAIDAEQIETNHADWWNSEGHRINLMRDTYRVFGHHIETRSATPDSDNNLQSWTTNIQFATQNFGRPAHWQVPDQYAFGLIYNDLDDAGQWTPRDTNDPLREGLANVAIDVFAAGTNTLITSATTLDNGTFSIPLDVGLYDILFNDPTLPNSSWTINDVEITQSWNNDLGLILIPEAPGLLVGDMNGDGQIDFDDINPFMLALNDPSAYESQYGLDPNVAGDINENGQLDFDDINPFVALLSGNGSTIIPEPTTLTLLGVGSLALLRRRHAAAA